MSSVTLELQICYGPYPHESSSDKTDAQTSRNA